MILQNLDILLLSLNKYLKKAKEEGFNIVAHAGEEADVSYIYEALDLLEVQRVDHGVQSIKSRELMQRLKKRANTSYCLSKFKY